MAHRFPARVPWGNHFPDVVVHTMLKTRDAHPGYEAAKSGDAEAALELAEDLLDPFGIHQIGNLIDNRPVVLLPVIADETLGFNAIPDAMAQILARKLDLEVLAGEVVQINKVGHTRAPSFQRLVTPAMFDGHVVPQTSYLLVDDHVGLGGTLANLRGYVEEQGGLVVGITTLTESRHARVISLRQETLELLYAKHGQALDHLWHQQIGHGLDCLTEVEAQILCRQPSIDAIEDFLATAAVEARGRGLEPVQPLD